MADVKSSLNDIKGKVDSLSESVLDRRKFGPKTPSGSIGTDNTSDGYKLLEVMCGMFGILLGTEKRGTPNNISQLLLTNPKITIFGQLPSLIKSLRASGGKPKVTIKTISPKEVTESVANAVKPSHDAVVDAIHNVAALITQQSQQHLQRSNDDSSSAVNIVNPTSNEDIVEAITRLGELIPQVDDTNIINAINNVGALIPKATDNRDVVEAINIVGGMIPQQADNSDVVEAISKLGESIVPFDDSNVIEAINSLSITSPQFDDSKIVEAITKLNVQSSQFDDSKIIESINNVGALIPEPTDNNDIVNAIHVIGGLIPKQADNSDVVEAISKLGDIKFDDTNVIEAINGLSFTTPQFDDSKIIESISKLSDIKFDDTNVINALSNVASLIPAQADNQDVVDAIHAISGLIPQKADNSDVVEAISKLGASLPQQFDDSKIIETIKQLSASLPQQFDDSKIIETIKQLSASAPQFDDSNIIKAIGNVGTLIPEPTDNSDIVNAIHVISGLIPQKADNSDIVEAISKLGQSIPQFDDSKIIEAINSLSFTSPQFDDSRIVEAISKLKEIDLKFDDSKIIEAINNLSFGGQQLDDSRIVEAISKLNELDFTFDDSKIIEAINTLGEPQQFDDSKIIESINKLGTLLPQQFDDTKIIDAINKLGASIPQQFDDSKIIESINKLGQMIPKPADNTNIVDSINDLNEAVSIPMMGLSDSIDDVTTNIKFVVDSINAVGDLISSIKTNMPDQSDYLSKLLIEVNGLTDIERLSKALSEVSVDSELGKLIEALRSLPQDIDITSATVALNDIVNAVQSIPSDIDTSMVDNLIGSLKGLEAVSKEMSEQIDFDVIKQNISNFGHIFDDGFDSVQFNKSIRDLADSINVVNKEKSLGLDALSKFKETIAKVNEAFEGADLNIPTINVNGLGDLIEVAHKIGQESAEVKTDNIDKVVKSIGSVKWDDIANKLSIGEGIDVKNIETMVTAIDRIADISKTDFTIDNGQNISKIASFLKGDFEEMVQAVNNALSDELLKEKDPKAISMFVSNTTYAMKAIGEVMQIMDSVSSDAPDKIQFVNQVITSDLQGLADSISKIPAMENEGIKKMVDTVLSTMSKIADLADGDKYISQEKIDGLKHILQTDMIDMVHAVSMVNELLGDLKVNDDAFKSIFQVMGSISAIADSSKEFLLAEDKFQDIRSILENDFRTIVVRIKDLSIDLKDLEVDTRALNAINMLLTSISDVADKQREFKDARVKFAEIDAILSYDFNSVVKALRRISEEAKEISVDTKKLEMISNMVQMVADIADKQREFSDAERKFEAIRKITMEGGPLQQVIEGIAKISKSVSEVKAIKGLAEVSKVMQMLTETVVPSPMKILRMKLGISMINGLLVDDFVKLTQDLAKVHGMTERQIASVEMIQGFMDALTSVADFGLLTKARMMINLSFLRAFVTSDVVELLNDVAHVDSSDAAEQLAKFYEMIETLKSLGDESKWVQEVRRKVMLIDEMMCTDVDSLVKTIANFGIDTRLFDNVGDTKRLIDEIACAGKGLPSLKDMIALTLKMKTMPSIVEVMAKLSKDVEKIDSTKDYAGNVLEIGDLIDNINLVGMLVMDKEADFTKAKDIITDVILAEVLSMSSITKEANKIERVRDGLIEEVRALIDSISAINSSSIIAKESDFKKSTDILNEQVVGQLGALESATVSWNSLQDIDVKDAVSTDKLLDAIIAVVAKVGEVKQINPSDIDKVKQVKDYLDELAKLSKTMTLIGKLDKVVDKAGAAIVALSKKMGEMAAAINKLEIDKEKLKALNESMQSVMKVVLMSAGIMLLAGAAMALVPVKNMLEFSFALTILVTGVMGAYALASRWAKNALVVADDLSSLIWKSAAVLVIAGLLMSADNGLLGKAMLFGVTLAGFIAVTLLSLKLIPKEMIDKGLKDLESIGKLVLLGGAVLVLGGLVMGLVNIGGLLAFAGTLVGFTTLVVLGVGVASNLIESTNAMKGLRDITMLVVECGALMVFAGLAMNFINVGAMIGFAATLTGFIFLTLTGIFGAIALAGNAFGIPNIDAVLTKGMLAMRDFGFLVMLSGATLVLGGLAMELIKPGQLIAFAATLTGFIFGITFAYALSSKFMKNNMTAAKEFGALVAISGAILLVGGLLLTLYPKMIIGVLEFAAVLTGFVIGVSFAYSLLNPEKLLLKTAALLVIVGVTGGILLWAAKTLGDDPMRAVNVLLFAITTAGFTYLMTLAMNQLSNIKNPLNAILGMAAIGLVTVGMAFAAEKIAMASEIIARSGGVGTFMIVLGSMVTAIGLLGGLTFGLAMLLGNGVTTGMAYLAIGVLVAMAGVTWILADSMQKIALAMQDFAKVPKIDVGVMLNNVGAIVAMATALSPLVGLTTVLYPISISVRALADLLREISMAVKDYADLKVPTEWDERGRPLAYRRLDKKDFAQAAENVKTIVSILGQSIIDIYKKRPDIFEYSLLGSTPFARVTKSLKTLGPMISDIAKAVKSYANMMIVEEWDTKGNPTKYRHMSDSDFVDASRNVSHIISTLGDAIVMAYEAHPEYYESSWLTSSPFAKTVNANKKLGSLISTIAQGVKNFAASQIAVKWDEKGNPIDFRHLDDDDYRAASRNIMHIISTVGNGIMMSYEEHPDWYEDTWFTTSPFAKTVNANKKLGDLISTIAKGVKQYAAMEVAVKWDEKGHAVDFRHLDDGDFKAAARNIMKIINTVGQGIMKTYDEHPDWYEDSWLTSSPFAKVVKTNSKLGGLISSIAKGVRQYAASEIAVKWDDKGHAIEFRSLNDGDFNAAAKNISKIINTLGKAMIETVNQNPEWYKETWFTDSPFANAVKINTKLGNLISKIANGVRQYAEGKVEVEWDQNGKAIRYENIGEEHYNKAAKAISTIITSLGSAIIDAYNDNKDMFDDGDDSPFSHASQSIGNMGKMISNIAKGMQEYANLKFAVKWDKDGNAIEYQSINSKVIDKVRENLSMIITKVGQIVIDTYKANRKMFDGGEESDFYQAAKAIGSTGEMIGSIANGLQQYANMRFPIAWDKDGKAIEFQEVNKTTLTKAGDNIGIIVTSLVNAVSAAYKKNEKLFDKGKDSNFAKAVEAISGVGQMVSSIVEGIQAYADMKIATQWDQNGNAIAYNVLTQAQIDESITNIKKVITTMVSAVNEAYKANQKVMDSGKFGEVTKSIGGIGNMISSIAQGIQSYASLSFPVEWDKNGNPVKFRSLKTADFDNAVRHIGSIMMTMGNAIIQFLSTPTGKEMLTVSNGFLGIGAQKESKFAQAVNAFSTLSKVISSISNAVKGYADMKVAVEWDQNGKPTKYMAMTNKDFTNTAKLIKSIITIVGSSIIETYTKNPGAFDVKKTEKMKASVDAMCSVMSKISSVVAEYANMKFGKDKLTMKDLSSTAEHISSVISAIAKPIIEIGESKMMNQWRNPLKRIEELYNMASRVLGPISENVKMFARMTFKDGVVLTQADIKSSIERIREVLSSIGIAIVDTVEANPKVFGASSNWLLGTPKMEDVPAIRAAMAIGKMTDPISKIAKVLAAYSGNMIPKVDKNGNIIGYESLSQKDIARAKDNMRAVILSIAKTSVQAYEAMSQVMTKSGFSKLPTNINLVTSMVQMMATKLRKIDETLADMDVKSRMSSLKSVSIGFITTASILSMLSQEKSNSKIKPAKQVKQDLDLFSESVSKILRLSQLSQEIGNAGYDTLSEGITTLYNATQQVQDTGKFEQHQKVLDKYVSTVNAVNVQKASTITKMVDSMNSLASKMGNVDKLTEAIASQLSFELNRLTDEMKNAKEIIETADKMQRDRHDLIKRSINEVKSIMDQSLTVEIVQVKDTDNLTGRNTGGSGGSAAEPKDDSTSTGGGSGSNVTPGNGGDQPTTDNGSKKSKGQSNAGSPATPFSSNGYGSSTGNSKSPSWPTGGSQNIALEIQKALSGGKMYDESGNPIGTIKFS